jgi:CHAD domain-containing protein
MRDYARVQTSNLLRRLAFQMNHAAKIGNADSVHDLRVAIRRLSRCLRAFSQFYPGHSWKRIRRELTRLMHMAGAVRDADITMELLAEAGLPPHSSVVAKLAAGRRRAAQDLLFEVERWRERGFSRKWRNMLEL